MASWQMKHEAVADCLHAVRRQKVHENFAGYLAVLHTAAIHPASTSLQVNFKNFFETFLRVPDGPHPYIQPFHLRPQDEIWFNSNVAGSYSPSSYRPDSPLLKVTRLTGTGTAARYQLVKEHWKIARQHLLFNNQIPIVPLAGLLYRNFSLAADPPTAMTLVTIFRDEFGYPQTNAATSAAFDHLYEDDSAEVPRSHWFEEV